MDKNFTILKKQKIFLYIKILIVIAYFSFIFYMSNQTGHMSNSYSYKIVSKIMNLLGVINYNIEFFNLILRKLSHFIEYFILLIVVFLLVEMFIKFSNKSLIISIIICFLYSVSDEIHQLFISGRTSNMFDVLIDSTGIIFSALIIYIIKNR